MYEAEQHDLSFEDALQQLKYIVEQLEKGDVPLNQALASFQKGVALSQYCKEQLDQAEEMVTQIRQRQEFKGGDEG